jgi:hypothetical protein
VAIVDGRATLVEEVERESVELREYLGTEFASHLDAGLSAALAGHLESDAGSQARLPMVVCTFDRLRRCPRPLTVGAIVQSAGGGSGVNSTPGPLRYEIVGIERRRGGPARDHLLVRARLTNLSRLAGTVGDGRDVVIEDAQGMRFPPESKLTELELDTRGLPGVYDPSVPDEPFETCWVFELPRDARALRLLLPFDRYELSITV